MTGLLNKRLILVVGKGGVGRSTVAASIASATARAGRRTLLFEASSKDRFGDFFGGPPVTKEICELRTNLFAVNTTPEAALEEYGLMVLRFRRVYKLVFENRITETFLKAIPGIEDYSILGKVWYHTTERKNHSPIWDTVVFDMPASGHCLSMLSIPWAITKAVPEGPLTRDAYSIQSLLLDRTRTAVVIVTMAEDMPSNEAIELREQLRNQLDIRAACLVVNQLYPDRFPHGSTPEQVLDVLKRALPPISQELRAVTESAELWQSRWAVNDEHLKRLKLAFDIPKIYLPRLFVPTISSTEIDTFCEYFFNAFGSSSENSR